MTGAHPEIPPELRLLAQSILDRLDPVIRFAAERATSGAESSCQQVWCPVCALAALVAGERHPLLTVLSDHGVALLSVVRAMADAADSGLDVPSEPEPPSAPSGPGRYQHIPVTVED